MSAKAISFDINNHQAWIDFLDKEEETAGKLRQQARKRRDLYCTGFLVTLAFTIAQAVIIIFKSIKIQPFVVPGITSALATAFFGIKYWRWAKYYFNYDPLGAILPRSVRHVFVKKVQQPEEDHPFIDFAKYIQQILKCNALSVKQLGIVYVYFQHMGCINEYEYSEDPIQNDAKVNEALENSWDQFLKTIQAEPVSATLDTFLKNIRPIPHIYQETQRHRKLLLDECLKPD